MAIAIRWIKLTDGALIKIIEDANVYMKLDHALL